MRLKILVLDDDQDILNVINTILSIYKYDCIPVKEWKTLHEKVLTHMPDLILLEINLAGKDGRELCYLLKNDARISFIPIILFSNSEGVTKIFNDCKAVDFVKKPFEVKDLLDKIKKHASVAINN